MKLVYIANSRIPTEKAHGIQITQMVEEFAKAGGISVELIVPFRFNKIKQDIFSYYGIEKNFKVVKLPCLDLLMWDRFLGSFAFWIQEASFCFFAFFYLLFKRIDVIYTRDKSILPFLFFKNKVFYEIHSLPRRFSLYLFWLKRISGIVAITENLKQALIERGVSAGKILVARDGVDLKMFEVRSSGLDFGGLKLKSREKLSLEINKKIILYTGHLYSWKGVATLLKTASIFQVQALSFQPLFVFVGGTEKDIFNFKLQASSLPNVLIVGCRPHSEIPLWLSVADVLVLPNSGKEDISRFWTSPLKMFEYMASGQPIVASDLSSIREVLNENNAVLVQSDNPDALLFGIKKILDNPELGKQLASQALRDVQEYTWQKRVQKILNFILQ